MFRGMWQICILKADMFKIPKGYESVTKTIRMPKPMAQELEILSTKNSISLNQLVISCIEFALSNTDKEDSAKSE